MELRSLHLQGALGSPRTEWLGDREYLVVPTVALVGDNVIHAVNSPEAEFVPARILSANGWDRMPLMLGHPTKNGVQISANDPDVLRASSFGFTSVPVVKNGRLAMESWCDVQKLEALGQAEMLADLRAGKPVEVSTGSFVQTRSKSGVHQGRRYATEWTSIGADHLAFLPKGVGACSIEMGCGAHRAAMQVEQTIIDPETLRTLRDIPQSVRDEMEPSDFAGPNDSFPIKTQADVDAAAHLVGKAANPGAVKAKIIAIAKRKGLSIPEAWKMKAAEGTIKSKAKAALAVLAGLFDTGEADAAEEAAELVAYNAMKAQLANATSGLDEAASLVDELIADEEENPTETRQQEAAEETVESARLDAIRMHCYGAIAALQAVCNACMDQQMPDDVTPSDPRYMEAFKALVGKEISAKNKKVIQSAHDASHDMHTHTVALGAECSGMKVAAAGMKDCPTCDGTGQTKVDGKQQDCPTCSGDGQVRAAEFKAACGCHQEVTVEKKERIAALTAAGVKDISEKTSDEVLTVLEAKVESDKKHADELKAAQEKQTETEAKLKAAEAAQIPAEELASLRALSAEKQQKDAAEKATLVTKLEPLKTLSKAELEGKTLDELKVLARFAKVDVDYSIIGTPVQRNAEVADEFKAPDPYKPGLDAMRTARAK